MCIGSDIADVNDPHITAKLTVHSQGRIIDVAGQGCTKNYTFCDPEIKILWGGALPLLISPYYLIGYSPI